MRIGDLKPKQNISLLINVKGTSLTFNTTIQESYPKKHTVYANAVFNNGKPLSFRGDNVIVDMLVCFPEERPILFKNVTTKLLKRSNGEFCYSFTTVADGFVYNRRENFRCYIGIDSSIQYNSNTAAHSAIIRDISSTGFAVVCDDPNVSAELGQLIHTVLTDRPVEHGPIYSFHLYGIVARIQELDNGNILYGCKFNTPVTGLDKYIMEKERLRLKRTNGGDL